MDKHEKLYLSVAASKGWSIPSQSRTSTQAAASQVEGQRPDEFKLATFHKLLVDWMVVDDQGS